MICLPWFCRFNHPAYIRWTLRTIKLLIVESHPVWTEIFTSGSWFQICLAFSPSLMWEIMLHNHIAQLAILLFTVILNYSKSVFRAIKNYLLPPAVIDVYWYVLLFISYLHRKNLALQWITFHSAIAGSSCQKRNVHPLENRQIPSS